MALNLPKRWVAVAVGAALTVGMVPFVADSAAAVDSIGADVDAVADTYVPSDAARSDVTVRVPVKTVSGLRMLTGEAGSIDIQVGGSGPIPVAVDTGFTGLILFPGAWGSKPSKVRLAKAKTTFRGLGADGTRSIKGFRGAAPITISGAQTVNDIPFVYTTSDSPFFKALRSTGVRGLMGIGVTGSKSMTNPLQSMPGTLGMRWSMHYSRSRSNQASGALILGAAPPTSPTMVFQMPPNGQDINGALLWSDHNIPACWTFGRLSEVCVPTTFDSEFTVLRGTGISGRGLQTDADGDTRFGTPVTLAAPDSAFTGWSYRTGQRASVNRTQIFKKGKPAVNTGNAVFFDFTITYDTATGKLMLSDPVTKAGALQ